MSTPTQAPATTTSQVPARRGEVETLEGILSRPAFVKRFNEVLGDRGPQFISSILSVGRTMPDVEPRSIVASAMIAATLDLPIEKGLGFAWLVPYRDGDKKYCQFQMGYKGYVQLGLRTGRYERMNAKPINAEALGGFDAVGERIIDWDKLDETKEAVGYVFAFKLVGGFTKLCYWPKKKVLAHAERYSQSFRKGSGPWKTHFEQMALKTVIANELSDWGILSVQWQTAKRYDQGVVTDIDADVQYVDNVLQEGGKEAIEDERKPEPTAFQQATQGQISAPGVGTAGLGQVPQGADKAKPVKGTAKTVTEPAKSADPKPETPPKIAQDAGKGVSTPPTTPNAAPAAAQEAGAPKESKPEPSNEAAEAAAGLAPVQKQDKPVMPRQNEPFVSNPKESLALQNVRFLLHKHGKTEAELVAHLQSKQVAKKEQNHLADLADKKLEKIGNAFQSLLAEMNAPKT